MKKADLVNRIVEDLEENFYDSKEYIFDLVRESLNNRTKQELKDINA